MSILLLRWLLLLGVVTTAVSAFIVVTTVPHSSTLRQGTRVLKYVRSSSSVSVSLSSSSSSLSLSSSSPLLQSTAAVQQQQKQQEKEENGSDNGNIQNHIVFPGGGIFFYHQAGIVTYLREQGYDLSGCTMAGASAGALTASLTANDVDFYDAAKLALQMATDANVWDRPGGLFGIWGDMNRDWLDQILPATSEEVLANVQNRVTLLVTPFPTVTKKSKVSTFNDRQDFIQANLASIHLPLFMDKKITYNFRNKPHIDGSFLSTESDYAWQHHAVDRNSNISSNDDSIDDPENPPTLLLPPPKKVHTLTLDWKDDPEMSERGGFDIVEAISPDGIYDLIERGKRFGRTLEEKGAFNTLPRRR